ncbi:MAG: hypothetical protein K9H25_01620 [Rhodospirillum sp.]|nr:hypothetical protein [Rhodospirillum sp.]MCF8488145.1 hypothetical protein [Rhodospirillum sp.]MCF8502262.1 hypothetical protein [Rhodospirillum sp.]
MLAVMRGIVNDAVRLGLNRIFNGHLTTALAKAWRSITVKGGDTDAALAPLVPLSPPGGRTKIPKHQTQAKEAAE